MHGRIKDWSRKIVKIKTKVTIGSLILILVVSLSAKVSQVSSVTATEVKPIFYESFDNFDSIKANGGNYNDITLTEGKFGKGVLVQGKGNLVFPANNHFNFQKGTIEFWVKPNWGGGNDLNGKLKYLLKIIWGETQSFQLPIYVLSPPHEILNFLFPQFNDRGTYDRRIQSIEPYSVMQWKPHEWHKVTIYWDFTIPDDPIKGNRSYIVGKVDDIFMPFKKVPPVQPEAMAANARIIVGQDHVLGRYPAEALIDELKIYDTSLLPVVPFPEYQFNPLNPKTEASFRKLFENDGFCSNFKTHHTNPADCPKLKDEIRPGDVVLFFQRPAFEQIYENYVPKEAEINNQFDYQAPIGEYETIFFNVYSRVDLNNVRVTYSEFRGTNGYIPKTNLDLRIVKNWFRAGRGSGTVADQLPFYVPELLLHNDQIPLETDNTLSINKVPSLPILDHVKTKISKYISRQFAMIVKVPENTLAGSYVSMVTLRATGIPDQTIKLYLEVLPFKLRDTGKIYSIWYVLDVDKTYATRNGLDVSKIFRKNLADIRNHGFNSVLFFYDDINKYKPLSTLQVQTIKIKAAQQAGFRRAAIYTGIRTATLKEDITPALKDTMMQHGFDPWLYGVDEIGELGIDYMMKEHINKSRIIHGIGGKVFTSTIKAASDVLDDPKNSVYRSFPAGTYEPLDWVIYIICDQYLTDLMTGNAKKNPNKLETFYWQSRDENPQTNRYLFGYFPWITGLDGASITFYQQGGGNGQFYNDFDWPGPDKRFRPYVLAYPSLEGPVPTFQWEAAREGIKDGKYLATWKYYQDEAAKKNPAIAQQSEVVHNVLEHYKDRVPTANTALYRNSMAQYEADRKTIINEIKRLMSVIGTKGANLPTP